MSTEYLLIMKDEEEKAERGRKEREKKLVDWLAFFTGLIFL